MTYTARTFMDALGGYKVVAASLGKSPKTIHTQMQVGIFPPAWFDALCALARENDLQEPSRTLFSFLALPVKIEAGKSLMLERGE